MILRTPTKTLVVVLTLVCLLASGGTSDARGPRRKKQKPPVPTTVTIDSVTGSTVAGTVSSKNAACVSGREVFFVLNDEGAGSTSADQDGAWSDKPEVVLHNGDEIVVELAKVKAGKRRCGSASDSTVVGNVGSSTTYVASVTVTGAGLVTSDPEGISCRSGRGTCGGAFPEGSAVRLSATPDANERRVVWGGDCPAASSTCTLRMTANRRASATFTGPSDACSVSESVPQLIRSVVCLIL